MIPTLLQIMLSVHTALNTVTFTLLAMSFAMLSPVVNSKELLTVEQYVQRIQLDNVLTYIVDDVSIDDLELSKINNEPSSKQASSHLASHTTFGLSRMSNGLPHSGRASSILSSIPFLRTVLNSRAEIDSNINRPAPKDFDPIITIVDDVHVVHDTNKIDIQKYLLQLKKQQPHVKIYPLYLYNPSADGTLTLSTDGSTSPEQEVPSNDATLSNSPNTENSTITTTNSPDIITDLVEEITVEVDNAQNYDFPEPNIDISHIERLGPSIDLVEESGPTQALPPLEIENSNYDFISADNQLPEESYDLVEESNPHNQAIPLIGIDTFFQPEDIVEEVLVDNFDSIPIDVEWQTDAGPILALPAFTGQSNRFFSFQYQLRNTTQIGTETIAGLDFQRAWDYIAKSNGANGCNNGGVGGCLGSSNIKIGFVDRGLASGLEDIDYSRVDLQHSSSIVSSTVPCNEAISTEYVTLPMNGLTYYFCEKKGVLEDNDGHGTKVLAINSMAHNNLGGMGIAPNATIGMKGLSGDFAYNSLTIAKAIRDYAAADYDIINLSLVTGVDDTFIHNAIKEAYNSGVTIVAAAGNCGDRNLQDCGFRATSNTVNPPMFPAFYPEVISVGSTEISSDLSIATRSPYSSFGGVNQIMVPIGSRATTSGNYGMLSVSNDGRYRIRLAFTSYAAPVVSGHIALMKTLNPTLTPSEIINIINTTALDVGPAGNDSQFGAGILQPTESLYEVKRRQLIIPPILVTQSQSINALLTLTPLRNRE